MHNEMAGDHNRNTFTAPEQQVSFLPPLRKPNGPHVEEQKWSPASCSQGQQSRAHNGLKGDLKLAMWSTEAQGLPCVYSQAWYCTEIRSQTDWHGSVLGLGHMMWAFISLDGVKHQINDLGPDSLGSRCRVIVNCCRLDKVVWHPRWKTYPGPSNRKIRAGKYKSTPEDHQINGWNCWMLKYYCNHAVSIKRSQILLTCKVLVFWL